MAMENCVRSDIHSDVEAGHVGNKRSDKIALHCE